MKDFLFNFIGIWFILAIVSWIIGQGTFLYAKIFASLVSSFIVTIVLFIIIRLARWMSGGRI